MSDDHDDDNDEHRYRANDAGGYRNPPVSGQFKPGGPGGPGRRRGTTSNASALRRMFASNVTIKRNGEPLSISMADAMAERLRKDILSGNSKALELGFKLIARYGPIEQNNDVSMFDFSQLEPEEKRVLRKLLMTAKQVDRREMFRLAHASKFYFARKAEKK